MTNLQSILKSRDITLPRKVWIVKAMVFPVVMYGCESWDCEESWAPKNWCFWTVMLEKTLESYLDCKEIQLAHPKGDQFWVSLEGLMLKLKLQYFDHLMRRVNSLEKTLMLGGIRRRRRDDRGWDGWMASLTWWTWVWVNSGSCDGQGGLTCCDSWGWIFGHGWATELNWTECWTECFKTMLWRQRYILPQSSLILWENFLSIYLSLNSVIQTQRMLDLIIFNSLLAQIFSHFRVPLSWYEHWEIPEEKTKKFHPYYGFT